MTATVRQKTISGFKWVTFSRYAQKAVSFVTFIILARLLEPEVFGLFAMAFIVIDGLGLFKNIGVDSALVQRKDDVEVASHTAFWMMPFLGAVIFAILYFSAPLAATFLREQAIIPVVRTLGIIFVLGAMENIPASILNKELRFKDLALRELVSSILFSISAVIFALLNMGIWSLVYAYLIKRVSMFIFSWTLSPYRPKLVFDYKIANELLHFGKFIFSASITGFFILNADNFLVGRLMGAEMLGYYALAYNISSITTTHLSGLIGRVLMPAYSKIQEAKAEIKEMSLKVMKVLSVFSFPFGIGLILFSTEAIGTVYGEKWLPLVPALQALAFCSMFLPVFALANSVYTACGKPKWSFYTSIPVIVVMILLIPLFSQWWGLWGVGVAVAVAKLHILPVKIILLKQIIDLKLKDIVCTLKTVTISTVVMFIAGITFKIMIGDALGKFSFILHAGLSTAIYGLVLYKIDKGIFSLLKRQLLSFTKVKTNKKAMLIQENSM